MAFRDVEFVDGREEPVETLLNKFVRIVGDIVVDIEAGS